MQRLRVKPRLCNSLFPTGQTGTNFKQTTMTKPRGRARFAQDGAAPLHTPPGLFTSAEPLGDRTPAWGLGGVHPSLKFPFQVKIGKSFPTPVPTEPEASAFLPLTVFIKNSRLDSYNRLAGKRVLLKTVYRLVKATGFYVSQCSREIEGIGHYIYMCVCLCIYHLYLLYSI